MKPFINISVDVEQDMPPFGRGHLGVVEGIPKILDIFKNYKIKATFFITGEICSKFPKIVKEIAKKHEIASHSWNHTSLKKQNIYDQYQNIKKSKEFLEKTTKKKVIGFRAPEHIITKETLNLLEILKFKYDSSALFHTYYPRKYNYLRYPSKMYHPDYNNSRKRGNMKIFEIPASTHMGIAISMFSLRFFGKRVIKYAEEFYRKNDFLIIYMHPWELVNLEKPKWSRKMLYRNLGKNAEEKLINLLDKLPKDKFAAIENIL